MKNLKKCLIAVAMLLSLLCVVVFTTSCSNLLAPIMFMGIPTDSIKEEYTVTFVADGVTVDTVTYTEDSTKINEPQVPKKDGYVSEWERYTLDAGNITVNAKYTPIEYTVTFVADEITLGTEKYTVEEKNITPPSIPEKDGYVGVWENYVLYTGDITVNAVYKRYSEGLNFELNSDENAYYVAGIGDCTDRDIVIPPAYNGKPVTSIDSSAFEDCTSLTSVTIPNSVTSIGESAFSGCFNLATVTFADGSKLTSIGENAFVCCYRLTSITISNSVTSIGENAFNSCYRLTSITIPNSVTSIGDHAFLGCQKLVEVINNSSLNITVGSGDNGMLGYYALNVKNGGSSDIVNKDGYLFYTYNGVNYLIGYVGNDTQLVLPQSYNGENYKIHNSAFSYCSSLTSITIPNSVTSIGNSAFSYCDSLTSVTIPNSVTSIGECAFSSCDSLTTVTFAEGSRLTSIGDYAFSWCTSLTSITIPNSVTSIGEYAFSSCDSLTSITIPNSVTSIGDCAFYDCKSLTSITIPDSVTSIGEYAFDCCYRLTSITIPNSVTSIGERAFAYCGSLTTVTFAEGSKLTSIGGQAFQDCSSLTNITIPSSVTSIGERAFAYCDSLTTVTFAEGSKLTSIGERAFNYCTSLTSITFKGTKAQWEAISKGRDWKYNTGKFTVTCTDGTLTSSEA